MKKLSFNSEPFFNRDKERNHHYFLSGQSIVTLRLNKNFTTPNKIEGTNLLLVPGVLFPL